MQFCNKILSLKNIAMQNKTKNFPNSQGFVVFMQMFAMQCIHPSLFQIIRLYFIYVHVIKYVAMQPYKTKK